MENTPNPECLQFGAAVPLQCPQALQAEPCDGVPPSVTIALNEQQHVKSGAARPCSGQQLQLFFEGLPFVLDASAVRALVLPCGLPGACCLHSALCTVRTNGYALRVEHAATWSLP